MQQYEQYKDSGVAWLGEVPSHWIRMPMKFSLAMPITDGPHETPEILSEGIPFISAEAVKNDKLDFNKKRGYISEEDNIRFSKKYFPLKGDIYMVKSGATTGNVAKVETDEVFNIWSPLAAIRPNRRIISTDFLFYVIKSDYFNTSVKLKWNMGTQQNIGMGVISNINIFIPSTEEQTAIATYLDSKLSEIDMLISKQETLLEKLAEQRTAIITHTVTKGLNPDVEMKNSGVEWLGEVPSHWEISRLKYEVTYNDEVLSDKTDVDYEMLYVDISSVSPHQGITKKEQIIFENSPSRARRIVKNGDVIVSTVRTYLKAITQIDNAEENLIVSTGFTVLRYKKALSPKFLGYWVQSENMINAIVAHSVGVSYPAINASDLVRLPIVKIPLSEQTAIADYLDEQTAQIDRLSERVQQVIESLKSYRSALITQAVTGKIKVI